MVGTAHQPSLSKVQDVSPQLAAICADARRLATAIATSNILKMHIFFHFLKALLYKGYKMCILRVTHRRKLGMVRYAALTHPTYMFKNQK